MENKNSSVREFRDSASISHKHSSKISFRFGFTLIELLVVVLIIGILAAVALPEYKRVVLKTRLLSLQPLLRAISEAENLYFLENNTYTLSFEDLSLAMPAGAEVETDNQVTYKDFYCYLRRADSGAQSSYSAYCNCRDSAVPPFEKYFSRNTFICWGGSAEKERICQDISGLEEPNAFTTSVSGYSFQN